MQQYVNDEKLNQMIVNAVKSIEKGSPIEELTSIIKNRPTAILKASPHNQHFRYRPGNQLITYNGIDSNGKLIQETWCGGSAKIKKDSVILRNASPIKYSKPHRFAGQAVHGFYQYNGQFLVVPPEKIEEVESHLTVGNLDILFNEYVSDVEFVKHSYGIEATEKWQEGIKLQPSYAFKIPSDLKYVTITTALGVKMNLSGGDYIVIDAKENQVISVHGVQAEWLNRTYLDFEKYRSLKK